jgi:hypothetical protein
MRMKGYPSWFYWMLMLIVALLFVSGCLLLPTTLELKLEWGVPWRLTADQHIGVAALHTAFSFLVLAVIGALWSIHMRAGWKRRRNHQTGLSLLILMLLLGITAIGIYYLGDDRASMFSSVLHMAIGLVIPLLLAIHVVIGRRYHSHH